MAAVGVKLDEASDAPSRGEVHIRFLSGQLFSCAGLDALGHVYPSRYSQGPLTPGSGSGRIARAAAGRMCANAGMADKMTTGLVGQGGGDSGNHATAIGKPRLSESASRKDPL